jgi:uncharacterized protein YcbK (DUF882 family)
MSKFACKCCGKELMTPEFLDRFKKLETLWGKELEISSGYRCAKHNAEVGGVADSSHCLGFAADIHLTNSTQVYKLVRLACNIFNRIGVNSKNGTYFVHVDCDPKLPQLVLWTY